jgi:hypothetical protein
MMETTDHLMAHGVPLVPGQTWLREVAPDVGAHQANELPLI